MLGSGRAVAHTALVRGLLEPVRKTFCKQTIVKVGPFRCTKNILSHVLFQDVQLEIDLCPRIGLCPRIFVDNPLL